MDDERRGLRADSRLEFEMPLVAMYQDLPCRLLSERAVSVTVEFVRINFRRAGEPLRGKALARTRMTHSASLGSTRYRCVLRRSAGSPTSVYAHKPPRENRWPVMSGRTSTDLQSTSRR